MFDTRTIISGIEARAAAIGLAISDLLRRSEIAPSTWSRWKHGSSPRIKTLNKVETSLVSAEAVALSIDADAAE